MAATQFANLNEIVSITQRGAEQALTVQVQRGFINGIKALGRQVDPEMKRIAKALDLRKIPRAQVKAMNLRIAEDAHQAVLAGWRSRLPVRSRPYRPEDRLTGVLEDVLSDPGMTSQTTDRVISPLNVRILNNGAEHWWRVNYGAQGPNLGKGVQPRAYDVDIAGAGVVATLSDPSPPAPQSWLPVKYQWGGTNYYGVSFEADEFVPLIGPAKVAGKGVRAARFSDLALESIAETFGPYTLQGYRAFLANQAAEVKAKKRRVRLAATGRG